MTEASTPLCWELLAAPKLGLCQIGQAFPTTYTPGAGDADNESDSFCTGHKLYSPISPNPGCSEPRRMSSATLDPDLIDLQKLVEPLQLHHQRLRASELPEKLPTSGPRLKVRRE